MDIVDLGEWRKLVQGGHALWWSQGEFVDHAMREAGPTARELLGVLATEAHCTVTSLRQKAECARAFEPGMRIPEKAPTWHRAVRNASLRTQRPLADVLKDALEKNYGQRELDAVGNTGSEWATWGGTCGDCGAKLIVKMVKAMAGKELVCGVCAVDADRPPILGRLT